jgi:WD40 repeat protein/serine/threonine protein kinase
MSDPSKKSNSESGGEQSRDHESMNMDATFVPESPAVSREEEPDYSATITGMPLPTDDDDEFDSQRFDDGTSNADTATFVPTNSEPEEEPGIDRADTTFIGFSAEENSSEDSSATVVPDQSNEVIEGDSFSGTVIAQNPEEIADTSTIINRSGEGLAAERGERPDATIAAQRKSAPRPGKTTVGLSQSGVRAPTGSNSNSSQSGSGTGSGNESNSQPGGTGGGTGAGSKVSSQIWTSSENSSLDELITIRKRPVSGSGNFTQTADADFEIVEKLAEGGMGVVYVARQRSLNRELAIKTLKSGANAFSGTVGKSKSSKAVSRADRQKREMFLSEALVTANLVHPNIIPIHELAETGEGTPYYVMKRVHGIPWNRRVTTMSLAENLDVLHKVCDAIAYAHHHGVINRDLKPENIMLGEFGEVLVLDWGLAVPAPHAAEQNFRSPVASFGAGTPAYMSPELWSGPPEAIGECSDIYLLGAILYEIVTGLPPHEFPRSEKKEARSDIWKVIDDVLRQNVIRPTTESGELLEIAMKAMRTNPEERFGSVLEFQFAVRNYQRHEESRRLSARATELVDSQANKERDYHTCQTAAALYEEALRTWPQNGLARNGLRTTRLLYANLAASKGDYDLGLQVATQESDAEFVAIARKLRNARRVRSSIKWTALTALLCVAVLGAKAINDHGIITNLEEVTREEIAKATKAQKVADLAKTEAEVAKAEAEVAKAEADVASKEAIVAKTEAEDSRKEAAVAKAEADTATKEAAVAKMEADAAEMLALKEKMNADMAKADATKAKVEAEEANQKAEVAIENAKAADAKVLLAKEQQDKAEAATAAAIVKQEKAETAADIAEVEIQSQQIRGLTLNENFADALRAINRLLEGEVLSSLPEVVRVQRTAELRAQRDQLLKRARPTEAPVQSQAMNSSGELLAQGDLSGLVVVMNNPAGGMAWPETILHRLQLQGPIEKLVFVSPNELLIAAGEKLHLWEAGQADAKELAGHSAQVKAIDVSNELAVTADVSGHIIVWQLSDWKILADMKANTSIVDLALIPGSRDFVYAGVRGGQSSEVLAYRVAADKDQSSLQRLGQLRVSRTHNYPASGLSVSPDGKLLVVSNRTNGSLFVLKANSTSPDGSNNQFPFSQPADLEAEKKMSWLVSHHSRPVNDLQWSADGTQFLTASDDRRIGVWSIAGADDQTATLTFRRYLRGHGARVMQAGFLNTEASQISSTSADGFSRLWDLQTLEEDSREIRKAFNLSQLRSTRGQAVFCVMPVQPGVVENVDLTSSNDQRTSGADESGESFVLNADLSVHRGSVRSVQYSVDGKRLVSGADDGSIVVWDTVSRSVITGPSGNSTMLDAERFQEGHEFNISRMLQIGPDKSILATAGFDGSLRLWNMQNASHRLGGQQQVISGLGLVNTFAASPDGQFLVTSGLTDDKKTKTGRCSIWKLADLLSSVIPKASIHLEGSHRSEITAISVSKDSRQIATGGRDGIITVWDSKTAQRQARLRAHGKDTIITSLIWLNDGSLLSAGLDGKVARWSVAPNSESDTTDAAAEVASDDEKEVNPVQAAYRLERVASFEREKTPVEQMTVSPDETRILVISVETDRKQKTSKYHLDYWQLAAPESRKRIVPASVSGQKPSTLTSAQWSADSQRVLLCADGVVQIFDANTWKVTRVFSSGGSGASDAQFLERPGSGEAPTLERVIIFDGTMASLWDLTTGRHLVSFRGPYPITTVACADLADHPLILAAGESLRAFDGNPSGDSFGRPLFHLQKAHTGRITSIAVNPVESSKIITAGEDGQILLWQWSVPEQTLLKVKDVAKVNSAIASVKWFHDATGIAFVSNEGLIGMTEADGTNLRFMSAGRNPSVKLSTIDVTADKQFVAVAGYIKGTEESIGWVLRTEEITSTQPATETAADSTTAAKSAQPLLFADHIECSFSGHAAGGINALRFVEGTPYLVSGGQDGSLILWNWKNKLPGAAPVAYEAYRFFTDEELTAHLGPITSLTVSATNELTSAGEDGRITVWNLPLLQKR